MIEINSILPTTAWSKWLQSLSDHDFRMMQIKETVETENAEIGQLTLPIFESYEEPLRPPAS